MLSRRSVVFTAIGVQFLLNGIEYALIFPSVWLYLEDRFHPPPAPIWLGLLISAYAMAGLFFSPFFGRIADKTRNTRWVLIVGNLFTIGGSFMYSLSIAPWYLMLSRFIAGIGGAVGGAMLTNITWATTDDERTTYLALFMAIRQIGLIIGPMFNFALRDFDFYIGRYHVDKLSGPGVFMAGLSTVAQIIFFLFYWDIHSPPSEQPKMERKVVSSSSGTEDAAPLLPGEEQEYQHSVNPVETLPPISHTDSPPPEPSHTNSASRLIPRDARARISSISSDCPVSETYRLQSWSNVLKELGREEIIALLFVSFAYLFNQGALEPIGAGIVSNTYDSWKQTALTPLTKRLYYFDEIENSFLYMGCGILIVVTFVFLLFLTRCCSDRVLFIAGAILIAFASSWYIGFIPRFPSDDRSTIGLISVGLVTNIVALPLIAASSVAMLTKLVAKENQGIIQGIRRATLNLALILGPIWTGGTINTHLYLFFAVLLSIYLVGFLMMLGSWSKLIPPPPPARGSQSPQVA